VANQRIEKWIAWFLLWALGLASCRGTAGQGERQARQERADVARRYRPAQAEPNLPRLTPQSSLSEVVHYAILRSPSVEAAYYDWYAAVERITPARSLPDPRLGLEADVAGTLTSLMPGLMIDLPGPGKVRAMGEMAKAEARQAYHVFEAQVLSSAVEVKTTYYQLRALAESIEVNRRMFDLLRELESIAQTQHAAGRATLQDVLRAQIEMGQVRTEIANLKDSRVAAAARYRAAMGVRAEDPSVPLPAGFEDTASPPDPNHLIEIAYDRNPVLRRMRAAIEQAEAAVRLAGRAGVPDFSVGLEADVKPSPTMWRPSARMTLPVWRDKIAAQIAAATAQSRAARSRLTAEEVALGAEFAGMLFMFRESQRDLDLLTGEILPRARQSLEVARTGYVSGRASFIDILDAQRSLLSFELATTEARARREVALANLSLTIAGIMPQGSPLPEERP